MFCQALFRSQKWLFHIEFSFSSNEKFLSNTTFYHTHKSHTSSDNPQQKPWNRNDPLVGHIWPLSAKKSSRTLLSFARIVSQQKLAFFPISFTTFIFFTFFPSLLGHHYAAGEWPGVSGVCVFHGSRYSAKKGKKRSQPLRKGFVLIYCPYTRGVESKGTIFGIGLVEMWKRDVCFVWIIVRKSSRKSWKFSDGIRSEIDLFFYCFQINIW